MTASWVNAPPFSGGIVAVSDAVMRVMLIAGIGVVVDVERAAGR
jgi:hypothetical protein